MSTVISNLKARFGVDTSDFRRGLKDGEKALADFKGVGTDQIDAFASMFGVNMSAVSNALNIAGKSLNFVGQSFKAAAGGADIFAVSMKFLRTALMATGVGALIVALGSLIAYFKDTEVGARQLASGMSQVKAVWETVKDRLGQFGGGMIDIFRGNFALGIVEIKDAFTGVGEAARIAGQRGKEVAQMLYDLTIQERQYNVTRSEQMILIDQLRLKSRDLELTAQERLNALEQASAIEKKINKEALDLAAQKILIAQKQYEIDSDDQDAKNALADAYIEYNRLVSESLQFEYSLTRQKNALIREIEAQLAAMKKLNDATKVSGTAGSFATPVDTTTLANMPNWERGKAQMKDFGEAAQAMSDVVNESLRVTVGSFAEWFGSFAVNVSTLQDGRKMVGNVFGDMLIQLGRVAIATGIGIEAIKKAFQSLGGIGAVAAGGALIYLGAAIKGSIASVGSSTFSSGSMSSAGGGSIVYDNRVLRSAQQETVVKHVVEIEMTGKTAKGLLEIEDTRRNRTT